MNPAHIYALDGQSYHQRPLVIEQIRQLSSVITRFNLSISGEDDINTLIQKFGSAAPFLAACILRDENGTIPWMEVRLTPIPEIICNEAKLGEFASELAERMTIDALHQIATDFFDCNPPSSVLEKIGGFMADIRTKITGVLPERTGSSPSSSPSPEETSPSETRSSGVTPSPT